MRFATRTVLGAFVLLLAGSAQAQDKNVTFQVNLTPYIDSCQFDDADEDVVVRGNFNDWAGDDTKLADDDGDGTFTGTFAFAEGTALAYKFVTIGQDNSLAFEDATGDRTYTVGADADQTIDVVTFADGDPVDSCTSEPIETAQVETLFKVDMNVAQARGVFDPTTDAVYFAGNLNGWSTAQDEAFELTESTTESGVYTKLLQFDAAPTGTTQAYKFIIVDASVDPAVISWESGGDRTFEIPEDPSADADNNGYFEIQGVSRFFNDVGFDQVLEEAATVTFRVDVRPAQYWLADNTGGLPFGAGSAAETVEGLYLNGPALWEATENGGPSGGIIDWVAWGADGLGSTASAAFTADPDDAGFWELTLTYPAGALRTLVGKLGVNGSDNEAASGNDSFYPIVDGSTINLVFGAMLKEDGSYVDDNGPKMGDGDPVPVYDPYILFNNNVSPPTVQSVRNGGENDVLVGIEDGPGIDGLAIGAAYPNPTRGAASLDLTLDRALDLRVVLYDVVGRQVATLADGPAAAGETTIGLDVSGLAPGVYLLRVEADGQAVTRRMTVLR